MGSSKSTCHLPGLTVAFQLGAAKWLISNQWNVVAIICTTSKLRYKTSHKVHSKKKEMLLEQIRENFDFFLFLLWIQTMKNRINKQVKKTSYKQVSILFSLAAG